MESFCAYLPIVQRVASLNSMTPFVCNWNFKTVLLRAYIRNRTCDLLPISFLFLNVSLRGYPYGLYAQLW